MQIPEFKVGDRVQFELSDKEDEYEAFHPRYDFGRDWGATGILAYGVIEAAGSYEVLVRLDPLPDTVETWAWPLPKERPDLYKLPGYLSHVQEPPLVEPISQVKWSRFRNLQ
jgi:hypothetical protein